jgi:hypothetical protein
VSENRLLRRIFGPKREKWQEARNDCTVRGFKKIRVINSRRMRWMGHTAHVGEMTNEYNNLVERLKERDHLKT